MVEWRPTTISPASTQTHSRIESKIPMANPIINKKKSYTRKYLNTHWIHRKGHKRVVCILVVCLNESAHRRRKKKQIYFNALLYFTFIYVCICTWKTMRMEILCVHLLHITERHTIDLSLWTIDVLDLGYTERISIIIIFRFPSIVRSKNLFCPIWYLTKYRKPLRGYLKIRDFRLNTPFFSVSSFSVLVLWFRLPHKMAN